MHRALAHSPAPRRRGRRCGREHACLESSGAPRSSGEPASGNEPSRLRIVIVVRLMSDCQPEGLPKPRIEQMARMHVLKRCQHDCLGAGPAFLPLGQHPPHNLALEIVLRTAEVTWNDWKAHGFA